MIRVDERFDITYIDPSSICSANRCLAKYMFGRLMGLQKVDRLTIAIDYGTDMHLGLPLCYSGTSDESMNRAYLAFSQSWNLREHEGTDDKRNTERAKFSLYNFAQSHSPELCPYEIIKLDFTVPQGAQVHDDEVPFIIDIGGLLPLAGRIDAIVKWKSDGRLWALDYKTSSEVSPRYFNNFQNCPQAVGYTLATCHITHEDCNGLIIEAIRTSKKTLETQMGLTFVAEHEMESFIRLTNRTAKLILDCNEKKEWPKSCTGCAPYGMFGSPGYMCDYYTICHTPDSSSSEFSNWKNAAKFYKKEKPFHPFNT